MDDIDECPAPAASTPEPDGAQGAVVRGCGTSPGLLLQAALAADDLGGASRMALAADERQHLDLLEALGVAIYTTDAEGRLTYFNDAAVALWGWRPPLGDARWCGSWRLYWPDGRPMPHDECPMAVALKENRPVRGAEAVAERPDGSRVPFLPYPTPLRDETGALVGAVNVLVDITERKAAEAARRASEARFGTLFHAAGVGMVEIDRDCVIRRANAAFRATLGRDEAELVGTSCLALTHPDDLPETLRRMDELAQGRVDSVAFESRYLRKDGAVVWVRVTVTPTDASNGRHEGFLAMVEDVSDRVAATQALAESEARLRDLLATLDLGASMARDPDGTILFWSEGCARLYGWTAEEAVGRHAHMLLRTIFPVPQEEITAALERDGEWTGDLRQRTRDGRELVVSACKALRRGPDGRPVAVLEALTDVTAQRRAEAALRESEAHLNDFFENAVTPLHWVGPDGTVLRANRAELQMLGYTAEEYVGHHIAEFHADPPVIHDILQRLSRGEVLHDYPARLRRKDGSIRHVLIHSNVLWKDGAFIHTRCFTRDITERKAVEEALREKQEMLRLAMRGGRMGAWVRDLADNTVEWSVELEEIFGLPPGGFGGSEAAFFDLIHPEDRATVAAEVEAALAEGRDYVVEFRFRHASGEWRWMEGRGCAVHDEAGRPARLHGLGIDITARKFAAAALVESEARFREMADNAPVMVWVTDPTGACTFLSRSWYEFTGQTPEAGLGFGWIDAVHPEDRERARGTFLAANARREAFRLEYRLRRADGAYRWTIDAAAPHFGPDGAFRGYIGSVIDIADRKAAEAALAESEARLRDLLATLDLGAFMARDLDGAIRFWSAGCARLYGWTAAEAVGRAAHDLLRTVFPVPQEEITAALERDGQWTGDLRQRTRDGTEIVVAAHKMLRRGPDGRPVAVLESLTDVTAQRRAEAALRESEARFRTLAETMPGIAWIADPDGTITYANEQWFRYTGIAPEQNARDWPDLVLHPEDRDRCLDAWNRALREGSFYEIAVRNRRHDGAYRWFLTRARPLRDEMTGAILRWIGTATDIDDRKRAEEALDRYRVLMQRARDIIFMFRPGDGVIVEANDAALAAYGHAREEMVGRTVEILRPPETRAALPDQIARAAAEGIRFETMHQRRDGSRFPVEVSAAACDIGGQRLIVSFVRDITERRAAEAALAESEARFRTIVEQVGSGVAQTDLHGRFLLVNDRYCEITGRSRDELLGGLRMQDITHPEDLPANLHLFERAIREGTPFFIEKRYLRPDGSEVWVNNSVAPVRDAAGRVTAIVAVSQDVTERRAAEAQRLLLAREVDHRAKNALTVVQALLRLTPTEGEEAKRFAASIAGRVAAMARAHTLLSHERWAGAELHALAREELAPYALGEPDRIRLDGPSFRLAPDAAQSFSMVLHELATNAGKYGALSVPQGRLEVTWSRDPAVGELLLQWREAGGPPPAAPSAGEHGGFGSRLITQTVRQLGGRVEFAWESDGLRCTLRVPAGRLGAAAVANAAD